MVLKTSFTLMAIAALSVFTTYTPTAEAHSYADCIDWRFKNQKNPSWSDANGSCAGFARRFPVGAKPFAKLDSDDPNRHYQQARTSNPLSCSNGKVGEEPGADETMAKPVTKAYSGKDARGRKTGQMTLTKAGGQLCIRWPAKNHAVPDEPEKHVFIGMSGVNPTKDPTQKEFLANHVAVLNYKNCTDKGKNTDIWPCGGCFSLPKTTKKGDYVLQWRWTLNGDENYTSCADIRVQ